MNIRIPKWLITVGIALGFLLLLILGVYLSTALGWVTLPAESLTAEEARTQVTDLTNSYHELQALADNLEGFDQELTLIEQRNAHYEDQSMWSSQDRLSWQQWSEQRIEARQEYNRRCRDYNARWDNFFESGAARVYGLDQQIPDRCESINLAN
ncbi:MAG: hypothetical protein UZ22_OP11002000794 [Microgenomates bacterium OLB23]|nr:MAG: hypothetical protein UZ22_OP11002000794 [Microgenomates bacterium OLB23]